MEIKFVERIANREEHADILRLLELCDREFIPPLSHRSSTVTRNLSGRVEEAAALSAYFENLCAQPAFMAKEQGRVIGFMSLRENFTCEEIPPVHSPNIYVTTILVHPDCRRRGITGCFYGKLLEYFGHCDIFTRTWSTNYSHIRILAGLHFYEHCRKPNDRGVGIDTVYYNRMPRPEGL